MVIVFDLDVECCCLVWRERPLFVEGVRAAHAIQGSTNNITGYINHLLFKSDSLLYFQTVGFVYNINNFG